MSGKLRRNVILCKYILKRQCKNKKLRTCNLSVDGGSQCSTDSESSGVGNIEVMMHAQYTTYRRTEHSSGVDITMPVVFCLVLDKFQQQTMKTK